MVASAFTYAADEATPAPEAHAEVQEVKVHADAKRVKAARSYSIASDGDMRDRVNLGVLGKANAFTAPNYRGQITTKKPSTTPKRVLWWMP